MPKRKRSAVKPRKARAQRRRPSAEGRLAEMALAAFAHEIRTPLTGIMASTELLATSGLGEREQSWLAAIKSNAEHLASLTTLAVDAARATSAGLPLRPERFSPRQLAEAAARSMRARAETKGLAASFKVAGRLPSAVVGDAARLRAALENLVDNAVKFTERGRVRLAVSARPAARGRVRLTFAISDTGIGLTAAEIRRLFRPFAQASAETARRFGGAGLGLAFVKTLAKAMGGDLTVTSTPSGGSTFRLEVVVDPAPALPRSAARGEASARAPVARRLKILCAEDNPYGRVVLNTIIGELGHAVDFVGSGEAAVEAAGRGYDLLLIDVVLPGIDGIEAARRIRALPGAAARIPIVGISGAEPAEARAAETAALDAFLVKPVGPAGLAKAFEAATSRRR